MIRQTKKLNVPYIRQINKNSCGAAALEMVYKYYGLKNISQESIFQKYQQLEPHGSSNLRITTDALVFDAASRGLLAFWGRANLSDKRECLETLDLLVNQSEIPVIVCQQFSQDQKQIGHFRVVVGVDGENILIHDPYSETGIWHIDKFVDFWEHTGENVTGGIFVVIKKL